MSALPFLTAPQLDGVAHGFFTRQGGVSSGLYDSLNTGLGSDDERADVLENRDRVRAALGAQHLVTAHQTHSAVTAFIDAPQSGIQADALVTKTPGLAIGALAADCAPILLADMRNGIIGAAHSGWRGAFGGIIASVIDTICAHGGRRADIKAIIGPCISQSAYEVGPEFIARFEAEYAADMDLFIAAQKQVIICSTCPGLCSDRLSVAMSPHTGLAHALMAMKSDFSPIAAPPIRARRIMGAKYRPFACYKIVLKTTQTGINQNPK